LNKKKACKTKEKSLTQKEKKNLAKTQIAVIMACDLQSDPSSAAFEQLMSKDVFEPHHNVHIPKKVKTEVAIPFYKAVEANFDSLKTAEKLNPLLNNFESAYMICTYSHG